jgi:NADH dehydrogenase
MIWLTGASGYVGRHILRRLIDRKARVRCLVLPDDPAPLPGGPSVDVVRGDLTRLDSFVRSGDGVDTVVHAASLMLPNPAGRIEAVNTGGTASLLQAASQWGARRFVYISAVSAVYETKNVYGASKARAERMVMDSGLAYTILRPTMIYGRDGGLHFQKLVGLIRRAPGALPILGPGRARLQPVWIEDVATAIELALSSPQAVKKAYNVSGQTIVTFNELVDRIMAAIGSRKAKIHVPLGLCLAVARLVSLVTSDSVLSPDALHGMNQDAAIDYRPFQTECGYDPISLDEGFARVFAGR